MKKTQNKIFLAFVCILALAFSGLLLYLSEHYTVPVMMYHRVNYSDNGALDTVSPENFKDHMEFLQKHHFRVISMDEFVDGVKQGKKFPLMTVVISFDDGYEDNYTYAFPVLKQYEFPAIIYVPSDRIGNEGNLSLAQMKEMLEGGIDFGSHTRNHRYLPTTDPDVQKDEIFTSKKMLEEKLQVPIKHFAYPIGGFSDRVKDFIKDAGYMSASTTNRGYDKFNKDLYEINRIRFGDKDIKDFYLWAKLSGYYNILRKGKAPH